MRGHMKAPAIKSFSGSHKWLSNFWRCSIQPAWSRELYPSVEHAYQASKTTNVEERREIRECRTPAGAKRLGKQVTLIPLWGERKIEIMKELVTLKFRDPDLRKRLTETKGAELVEGNWWGDTFWGVSNGVGENHLGKILMEIREDT